MDFVAAPISEENFGQVYYKTLSTESMKQCTKCSESKKTEEFYPCKGNRDGRQGSCKVCWSKNNRKRRMEIKGLVSRDPFVVAAEEERKSNLAIGLKKCNGCGKVKILKDFCVHKLALDGREGACRVCRNERQRKNYQRPEVKAKQKIDDKERNQRPEVKARHRELAKKRRAEDPNFKIAQNLRRIVRQSIKNGLRIGEMSGKKAGSAVDDLGCSVQELIDHLEKQFEPGMTWANLGKGHGKWNIDHIVPLAAFNLTNRDQFLSAVHHTNLRPLWSEENTAKGDRF